MADRVGLIDSQRACAVTVSVSADVRARGLRLLAQDSAVGLEDRAPLGAEAPNSAQGKRTLVLTSLNRFACLIPRSSRAYVQLLAALRSSKFEVPAGYETMFEEARLTFRHQTVFDPVTQKLVPMSPLSYHLDGQELAFLGPMLPLEVAVGIANGQLHPYTFEEFQAPAAIPESAPPAAAAEATKPDEAEQAQDVDFPAANPLPPPSILLPPPHASSSSSSSSTVHVHTTYEHTTFRPKWHAEEPAAVAADDTPGLYDWDVPDVGDADSQPSVPAVPQPPPPVIQRVQLQQCPASFPLNMLHFSVSDCGCCVERAWLSLSFLFSFARSHPLSIATWRRCTDGSEDWAPTPPQKRLPLPANAIGCRHRLWPATSSIAQPSLRPPQTAT